MLTGSNRSADRRHLWTGLGQLLSFSIYDKLTTKKSNSGCISLFQIIFQRNMWVHQCVDSVRHQTNASLFLVQAKTGIVMNIIGILCITLAINSWGRAMFHLDSVPTWANVTGVWTWFCQRRRSAHTSFSRQTKTSGQSEGSTRWTAYVRLLLANKLYTTCFFTFDVTVEERI